MFRLELEDENMETRHITVVPETTPLVSMDGIAEFTVPTGSFYREFGKDADPLIEWGERVKKYIEEIRMQIGKRFSHIAIKSKYVPRQFHDEQGWPKNEDHALDNLCVDDTYRGLTIDKEGLAYPIIEKRHNDPSTAPDFERLVGGNDQIVLIGVTTTTCVKMALHSLLSRMDYGKINLKKIILARNGVAERKSRRKDAERILGLLARDDRILIVPKLTDIDWGY